MLVWLCCGGSVLQAAAARRVVHSGRYACLGSAQEVAADAPNALSVGQGLAVGRVQKERQCGAPAGVSAAPRAGSPSGLTPPLRPALN